MVAHEFFWRNEPGSRGFTAAALFRLTLFRPERIIHGATYFEDAGQRLPVRDVVTIVQYDTTKARSSHFAWPTTVARHLALCPQTDPQTDAFSARCWWLLVNTTFYDISCLLMCYWLHFAVTCV